MKDVVKRLGRDAEPVVGAFEKFFSAAVEVGNLAGRLMVQFFSSRVVLKLLTNEQTDLFDARFLSLKVTLNGGIEDAFHTPKVLPNLFDLFRDTEQEVHVLFFVAAEVVNADIPYLPVAGNTTVPLL